MNGEQPTTEQPLESHEEAKQHKRTFWKFTGAFLIILFITLITYGIWYSYFGETIEREAVQRQREQNVKAWQNFEAEYERAMREDTFGGTTPQETLDLFVAAMEAENIELATKYFGLQTSERSEYYLTRVEWKEGLERIKQEGKIEEIIFAVKAAKIDPSASIGPDYSVFTIRNAQGVLIAEIDLRLNEFSGIWKIISM